MPPLDQNIQNPHKMHPLEGAPIGLVHAASSQSVFPNSSLCDIEIVSRDRNASYAEAIAKALRKLCRWRNASQD